MTLSDLTDNELVEFYLLCPFNIKQFQAANGGEVIIQNDVEIENEMIARRPSAEYWCDKIYEEKNRVLS